MKQVVGYVCSTHVMPAVHCRQPTQLLAAPKAMRPASDGWLVSASLALLDGACSAALEQRLGWSQPVPANVVAVQLLALSSQHAQVRFGLTRLSSSMPVILVCLISSAWVEPSLCQPMWSLCSCLR